MLNHLISGGVLWLCLVLCFYQTTEEGELHSKRWQTQCVLKALHKQRWHVGEELTTRVIKDEAGGEARGERQEGEERRSRRGCWWLRKTWVRENWSVSESSTLFSLNISSLMTREQYWSCWFCGTPHSGGDQHSQWKPLSNVSFGCGESFPQFEKNHPDDVIVISPRS